MLHAGRLVLTDAANNTRLEMSLNNFASRGYSGLCHVFIHMSLHIDRHDQKDAALLPAPVSTYLDLLTVVE